MMKKRTKKVVSVVLGVAMAMALVVGFAVKDKTSASANANKKISIKKCAITLPQASFDYTGKEIRPEVRVNYNGQDLENGVDYVLHYKHNVNAGKGTIAVEGKGNYKSADFVHFTIVGIDLANCKVFLDNSKRLVVTYNGSELLMNRDYTVYTYSQKKLISQVPINGMNMNTYEKTTYYAVTGNGKFFNTINITDVEKEVKYEQR